MLERFEYYFSSQIIKDKKTGQRYYGNKPLVELLNELHKENAQLIEENEQLKQFIKDLATKGTGRIDLANGYCYYIKAILTDFKR